MKYKVNLYYGDSSLESLCGEYKLKIDDLTGLLLKVNNEEGYISYIETSYSNGGHGEGNIPKHVYVFINKDYVAEKLKTNMIVQYESKINKGL